MSLLTFLLLFAACMTWAFMVHLKPDNRHVEPGPMHRFLGPIAIVLVLLSVISFIRDLFV
jgi:hypothetical protein